MKLLFCPNCWDVFKLDYELRQCKCGKCKGMYEDERYAVVNGEGRSLAIGNGSLMQAMLGKWDKYYKDYDTFIAWVRPHEGERNPHTRVDPNLGKEDETAPVLSDG